ncbi:N-acetylglucosamine kinase [Streptomyces sp. NPDC093225]|uniref:N-acetylglucosamine kinase n=1 Tax=Streptomyces sp. NPDC093225 TaxID=3366034 RepID=UPI003823A0E8
MGVTTDRADGVVEDGTAPGALPLVLAVDAGNSKTDIALVDTAGTVLATGRGPGFQPQVTGLAAAFDAIAATLAAARTRAAAAGTSLAATAAHVSACLANADLPVEEAAFAAELGDRAWGRSVEVRNDTFAVLRAGLPAGAEPRGVAVVCGAGINCVGMTPDGRTARFPALGQISGDWGGGGGLADEALWFAARAEDGRGEPTALARALPEHFGLPSMPALIEALHLDGIPRTRRHELTPVLFAVAADGDPVARALVHRQADEVVAMAAVALDRLGLLSEEVPVVLGGSVLAARHPQLHDRIAERLAARAPRARLTLVTAPPVLGAALLGLDAVAAPPEAHTTLRAHYA